MRITLSWDDDAIEHIARHAVGPEEVDGVTDNPRYSVVVEPLGRGSFYLVTAYEMNADDRRATGTDPHRRKR